MIEIQKGQKDTIRPFFSKYEDTLVWSCLDDCMGRAFADDPQNPKYAKIITACFVFLAGDATAEGAKEFISYLPDDMRPAFLLFIPENETWGKLIEEEAERSALGSAIRSLCSRTRASRARLYGECTKKIIRYAIKKEGDIFDREKLRTFIGALDAQFELRRIDGDLYDACIKDNTFHDFCGNFESKEAFLEHGIGFVILKGGEIVSGASSYSYYGGGIEIEIDTKKRVSA